MSDTEITQNDSFIERGEEIMNNQIFEFQKVTEVAICTTIF